MNIIEGKKQQQTIAPEALGEHIGEAVWIQGSIYKIRKMKGFAFVLIRTASCVIQSIYTEDAADFPLDTLAEESCCLFYAQVVAEERSRTGWELRLLSIRILSCPTECSPLVINQKEVNTSLEHLLHYRPITLRNEKERTIFRIQAHITAALREFFQLERFTEIHTPKIVYAGAEGGANIFRLDYFGKEAYLAQSPQFYKQMMVGVFERVYEIGPVFRAEKHDTARHLNEYTSVDLEMGYLTDYRELMELETRMLKHVLTHLQDHCAAQLALFGAPLPQITGIPALSFAEAKELIASTYHREITDWEDFEPEEEKLLCQLIQKQTGSEFVFVTHYPSKKRPFYAMDDPKNPTTTLSFDLLFRGLEITTGGQRIHTYLEQIQKMEARSMHPELFSSYLMMHRYGMPPHGGLGLGLERFTCQLLNLENVRYATLFPRDIQRLEP